MNIMTTVNTQEAEIDSVPPPKTNPFATYPFPVESRQQCLNTLILMTELAATMLLHLALTEGGHL